MTLLPGQWMTFNPAGVTLTIAVERAIKAFAMRYHYNPPIVYVPGVIPSEQIRMWRVHGVDVRQYEDALGLVRVGPVDGCHV